MADAISQRVAHALQAFHSSLGSDASASFSDVTGGAARLNPTSRSEFLARTRTYKIFQWFNSPLSPFECSRQGWVNSSTDTLTCTWCKQAVTVQPTGGGQQQVTLATLGERHASFCPWRTCRSPALFSHLPTAKALKASLAVEGRLLAPGSGGAAGPCLGAAAQGHAEEAWTSALAALAPHWHPAAAAAAFPPTLSAALAKAFRLPGGSPAAAEGAGVLPAPLHPALLVLCGWRRVLAPEGPSSSSISSSSPAGSAKRPRPGHAEGGILVDGEEGKEVACFLCGAQARLAAGGGVAVAVGRGGSALLAASGGGREEGGEPVPVPVPVSSLVQATQDAFSAAAEALEVFSRTAPPLPAPSPPKQSPLEVHRVVRSGESDVPIFHPIFLHAWACPLINTVKFKLRGLSADSSSSSSSNSGSSGSSSSDSHSLAASVHLAAVAASSSSSSSSSASRKAECAVAAAASSLSAAVSGAAENALVQQVATMSSTSSSKHLKVLQEIVKKEEAAEEAEEEAGRSGSAEEGCVELPGWVASLLSLLQDS
jgi:hypothetical protein